MVLLPWPLRRVLLQRIYGYQLHPSSRIGLAWVFPRKLVMESGSTIGHLTVCKGLELLALGEYACIGRLNWISAYPRDQATHFGHIKGRQPQLVLQAHSAITNRHIIDCNEKVSIGRFTTVAGYRSQILTHSIDLRECRQDAKPVTIGCYCFIGTACTILGGTVVPDYSVVGAHALLNKAFDEPYRLYAGVPATVVAELDPNMKYFTRNFWFVT